MKMSDIKEGDRLRSEWDYDVIARRDKDGNWYGELVCEDDHPCKTIPYALNDGEGYEKGTEEKMNKDKECPQCGGLGYYATEVQARYGDEPPDCDTCKGKGRIICQH